MRLNTHLHLIRKALKKVNKYNTKSIINSLVLALCMIFTSFICLSATARADSLSVSWNDMEPVRSMELSYATQFGVDYYDGGYKLISISGGQYFLVIPEGAPDIEDVPEDIMVLHQPLDHIYLAATSAMDHFHKFEGLNNIAFSSQKADGWYIEEARAAMEAGDIVYAGKYSAPDYELLLSSGCDLAIENTMIYHTPEVMEQIIRLGIPVIVERSSYEEHPLGRMEWIKLYAALIDREDAALQYYDDLRYRVEEIMDQENTGKTVAFFSINSVGAVNVRKSGDYVAKSIHLAGGQYISYDESEEENSLSTMNIQMETFYSVARDADVIIYNSTIEGEIGSIDELLHKSPLLADFKAVQEGNAWCIEKNFYQESLELGELILDVNRILTEEDPDEGQLYFLHRLQ